MKRYKTFWELLYRSFTDTYGPALSTAGGAATVIAYFIIPATSTIPFKYVLVIFIFALWVFWILLHAAYAAHQEERSILPQVCYCSGAPKGYGEAVALLLLEPSKLFSYGVMVSTYFENDGMEKLIGLGKVINIQENGKIQVLITHPLQYSEDWDLIKKNDTLKLKRLFVKPTIPGLAMEVFRND